MLIFSFHPQIYSTYIQFLFISSFLWTCRCKIFKSGNFCCLKLINKSFISFYENTTVGRMQNFYNLSTKSRKRDMISVFIRFHEESSHTLMNGIVLGQNSCSIDPYELWYLSVCLWNLLLAMVSLWLFPFLPFYSCSYKFIFSQNILQE